MCRRRGKWIRDGWAREDAGWGEIVCGDGEAGELCKPCFRPVRLVCYGYLCLVHVRFCICGVGAR